MSLETLLEAARYLEYKSEVKARGEEPHDYYTFARLSTTSNNNNNSNSNNNASNPPAQASHSYKHSTPVPATLHSSDESKERRRAGPSTSRDSQSQEHSGSGTREVHNKLEKNRRAHLKECFEALKRQLPNMDDRKTSNLSILRGAIRFIQTLKRKEREYEHDLERLAREKIAFQQRLALLKKDITAQYDHIDVNAFMSVEDNETTTTASECGGGSDVDDDFQSETSQKSNQNSMSASDATSSISSSAALSLGARSVSTTVVNASATVAFPKPTSFSSVFPSVLKSSSMTSPPKLNSSYSSEALLPTVGKNLARVVATDGHNIHLTNSDVGGNPQARVIAASSLQAMTGILTSPHSVQVISPPSNIKLLATQNSVSPSVSSVPQLPTAHRPQGQIHVLASSGLSYVAAPSGTSKTSPSESLQQTSNEPASSSKQQLMSPVTIVSSPTFVGLSQVATMAKPLVINQTANFSELMMASVSSSSLTTNHVLMKPSSLSSSMFGTNMALTIKNSLHNNSNATAVVTSTSSLQSNSSPHATKPNAQIIQPTTPAQNVSSLIHSEGMSASGIGRQVAVASTRPHSISNPAANLFAHGSNMAHLVSQTPISVSASQLVNPANHVSGITPLVGSVSVVSHTGAVHHQILAQSQPIGKVLASPILKSINQVNQIPIIQQQFLQATGSLPNQQIVKPVVVVSMPNIIPSGSVQPLTTRSIHTAHDQRDIGCSPSPGLQK